MKNISKIGFWGYPDPKVVNKLKSESPSAEWIDLDIDFKNPKSNILPDSYCKIIKNIIDKSVGKAGDKLGEKVCTLILYQPKVCRRMKK